MNDSVAGKIVRDLYHAVDRKDVEYLAQNLSDNIRFRIGNNPAATDKDEILDANKSFFNSIQSMSHTLSNIIQQDDQIACYGRVDYVRLDGSQHSAYFSTFLRMEQNKICDYLVFADISGLF